MRVQFLYFSDCPNHDAARAGLRRCMAKLNLAIDFEDIDVTAPETPAEYRSWGSPTILVNGVDVSGLTAQRSEATLTWAPCTCTVRSFGATLFYGVGRDLVGSECCVLMSSTPLGIGGASPSPASRGSA